MDIEHPGISQQSPPQVGHCLEVSWPDIWWSRGILETFAKMGIQSSTWIIWQLSTSEFWKVGSFHFYKTSTHFPIFFQSDNSKKRSCLSNIHDFTQVIGSKKPPTKKKQQQNAICFGLQRETSVEHVQLLSIYCNRFYKEYPKKPGYWGWFWFITWESKHRRFMKIGDSDLYKFCDPFDVIGTNSRL